MAVRGMAFRLAGCGERCRTSAAWIVCLAQVPELNAGIGLGACEQEILAAGRKEGEGSYGNIATAVGGFGFGGSVGGPGGLRV